MFEFKTKQKDPLYVSKKRPINSNKYFVEEMNIPISQSVLYLL